MNSRPAAERLASIALCGVVVAADLVVDGCVKMPEPVSILVLTVPGAEGVDFQ